MITLSGCGIETKWQFPEHLTRCPIWLCTFAPSSRSNLIAHYKTEHAHRAILCDLCNKPISCADRFQFQRHFHRMHSMTNVSYGLGDSKRKIKKVRCKFCDKMIFLIYLRHHLLKIHKIKTVHCPLRNCTYITSKVETVRLHWNQEHTTLRFPEIRTDSIFTYQPALTSNHIYQKDVSSR